MPRPSVCVGWEHAQGGKNSRQVTIKHIDKLLTLVLSPVRDLNPQVRWATTDSIWRVYMNLGPNINERCQDRILVTLSALIKDSHQRVLSPTGPERVKSCSFE
ncbi:hypothetical protein M0R45_019035 [Rubus argutus]|uniref:Uncharacterized protein n=1 Tax=Rubus argutus TaxID=59490 RepID=A0AAW1X499_RUBAR